MKNPIYPCLWFDNQAKDAAAFYCTVFNDTEITAENPIVVTFESAGQKFMCLNGGSLFKINPSISFFVVCETEEELMKAWNILIDDGSVLMALDKYEWSEKYGWVQDKFGVNWQLSFGKLADVGQKFTPTLMFTENVHGKAEQAINFYTSVFKNSDIIGILRYTEDDHDVAGTVKHAQFRLNKNVFMAMDSGLAKGFGFNEAVSFVVECENQEEIDYFWEKLTEGGEESMCGWLKDQYGVSWQIIPEILENLMNNPEKSQKVVEAFLKMKKFDIETLLNA
ncbi:3-demethylubiquinone-9 3-methyltransferase [Flavobacterium limnosediminis JC2902]|uniref:3-demethylubiquinone-9 3-methyltransferase n=1 Tax=Flavobacterium limnosediminis JC2902 TaxID=1341181 RepID=V6SK83_9FLAO|nr:VOC family protein [Flavobacterium limnosediminis]ESU27011.1 3-demethylubiquinone-9 3-methyltransferase [Flavobacterium limnosediminis JC2902]